MYPNVSSQITDEAFTCSFITFGGILAFYTVK